MKVELPNSLDFPSGSFLEIIPNLMIGVAPEKAKEIEAVSKTLTLGVTDSAEFVCHSMENLIIISRKAIEICWAFCFSVYTIYKSEIEGIEMNGQFIDLGKDSLLCSRKLMTWAMDNITGDQISELPEDCPKISDSFLNNSDMHMIYNLTQIAVGFLLHHELVHIKVINQHLEFSILDEESYCDKEAARIILDISDNVLLKYRGLGVAIGLLLILSHGMPTRNFDGNSHPFSYDRLIYTLSPYADPDNDVIWGFTVAILALQMTNFGIQQPIKEFDNFYECVQEYRNLLENYSSLN